MNKYTIGDVTLRRDEIESLTTERVGVRSRYIVHLKNGVVVRWPKDAVWQCYLDEDRCSAPLKIRRLRSS